MPTIEFYDVEETIKIGELFDQLGLNENSNVTSIDGDSIIKNEWSIEVKSIGGYYPIELMRRTKLENQVKVATTSFELICAHEHLLLKRINKTFSWVKVCDLSIGDIVVVNGDVEPILTIETYNVQERLCDMQVSIAHSFYTNNMLSHNSHFLVQMGAAAMLEGIDVVHYTLELKDTTVGVRYDSHFCNISSSDVYDHKQEIIDFYTKNSPTMGKLYIKEFPTNSATIYTLKAHLQRLALKGFRPGLVIVDYADIMRSTRQYDSVRHELKLVYEELRALAMEINTPFWSASQSNRDGANADVIDMTNMSESYGKAFISDVILSISRKSHEKALGTGRLYVAKNRAGKDGLLFPVKIDTACSRFEIVGEQVLPADAVADDMNEMKRKIREKFDAMRKDETLFNEQVDSV